MKTNELLEHLDWVRQLARSLVTDENLADDLVQDAYVAAALAPPSDGALVRPWFRGTMRNLIAARARKEGNRRARESSVARPEAAPTDSQLVERVETEKALVGRVMELREPYRRTILLRYFEGMSVRAIAEQEGVGIAAVKSRLGRGQTMLREKLDSAHGGDGRGWILAIAPVAARAAGARALATTGTRNLAMFAGLATMVVAAAVAFYVMQTRGAAPQPGPDLERVAAAPAPEVPEVLVTPETARVVVQEPEAPVAPPEPEYEPEYERSVQVRVVSAATGDPVASATVLGLDRTRRNDPDVFVRRKNDTLPTSMDQVSVKRLTGSDGECEMPWSGEGLSLEVRAPGLWGAARVKRNDPEAVTVELHPDQALEVTALDASGHPAPGIRVAIGAKGQQQPFACVECDPDGVARFDHAGGMVALWPDEAVLTYRAEVIGLDTPWLDVPRQGDGRFAEEPLTLTLPPVGRVEISTEFEELFMGACFVQVDDSDRVQGLAVPVSADSPAVLGAVALGQGFKIDWSPTREPERTQFAGPTQAGQTVRVELGVEPKREPVHPMARLTLVDEERRPLSRARVRTWTTTQSARSGGGLKNVDARGDLVVGLGLQDGEMSPATTLEIHMTSGGTTLTANVEIPPVPAGETLDLGNVVLRRAPIALAGNVLDSGDAAVEGAVVELRREVRDEDFGDAVSYWEEVPAGVARTGADGRFEIRATTGEQRLQARARAAGQLGAWTDVLPETVNCTLRVAKPVETSLRVETARPSTVSSLRLTLLDPAAKAEPWVAAFNAARSPETFTWGAIPPGTYDLVVHITGSLAENEGPVLRVGRVQVGADGAMDPRVSTLDLRPHLLECQISIVDPTGVPVEGATLHFEIPGEARSYFLDKSNDTGTIAVIAPRRSPRVALVGSAFLEGDDPPVRLEITGDQILRLRE